MPVSLLLALAITANTNDAIRVNLVGYLPDAPKVAVVCLLGDRELTTFEVVDPAGRRVYGPRPAVRSGGYAGCIETYRLDFSALTRAGTYRVRAAGLESAPVHVSATVWNGLAEVSLRYMREQRSGYNPVFDTLLHQSDGVVVDHPTRAGERRAASGGWADASDYLQYVTTSATATFQMLQAWRDHPTAFGDAHDARGRPGRNGVPDVLDEARHGLEWLLMMFPDDSLMLNQLGDDRDHVGFEVPAKDASDYGWGSGGARPLYPCTGLPQGLLKYRNRATGHASTAGKFAAAFALGAQLFATRDRLFADSLRRRARAAYAVGVASPGACQTAPARGPYFYEEDDWADDMELGAAALHSLTGEAQYHRDALRYAAQAGVKPWQGADTASHYQWYPFHNLGHYELARGASRGTMQWYREGLARIAARANNGFQVGIPFIWCSNDLMASVAVQAALYRGRTGDRQFRGLEQSAIDWLFGVNPWGISMVIGIPAAGGYPRDPHSVVSRQLGIRLDGGLIDGPVYRSIYEHLLGISLTHADAYAPWNSGFIVYHDDFGDYSTNEPIMDGAANVLYLLSTLARPAR